MVRLFQEPRVRGRREEVPALGPSRGRVGNCGGKWDGTGLGGAQMTVISTTVGRNPLCQTVFHESWAILHSQQQCVSIAVFPKS